MILNLGRLGDIVNLLPLCWLRAQTTGLPVEFLVGHEFVSVLRGVSYVRPLVVNRGPIHLQEVAQAYPQYQCAQVFQHPDPRRLARTFAHESYRLIGELDKFGTAPTTFDRRDREREEALCRKHGVEGETPIVAVALEGVSSPLPRGFLLLDTLQRALPGCRILDLSSVRAEYPFDLLGILDRCAALVAVDTLHLWLARASTCPVVSLHNEGWLGSPPPPQAVASFRYSKLNHQAVAGEVARCLRPVGQSVLVIDKHGDSDRHRRAAATWGQADVLLHRDDWERRSERGLPYLKDLLSRAMRHTDGNDMVVWTNGDVQLRPGCLTTLHAHVSRFGACTVRRHAGHIGRELFAFSADWLRDHMASLPDAILAAPWFDLAVARYIRQTKGINTTMENLHWDFFPAELHPGLVEHEEHPSSWTLDTSEAKHNEAIWNEKIERV